MSRITSLEAGWTLRRQTRSRPRQLVAEMSLTTSELPVVEEMTEMAVSWTLENCDSRRLNNILFKIESPLKKTAKYDSRLNRINVNTFKSKLSAKVEVAGEKLFRTFLQMLQLMLF